VSAALWTACGDIGLLVRVCADKAKIVSVDLGSSAGTVDLCSSLTHTVSRGRPVWNTAPFDTPAQAVLSVSCDNGFWVRKSRESRWSNTSKRMMPAGIDSNWVGKWGKTLLGPGSS
jgi:hypothetical protein